MPSSIYHFTQINLQNLLANSQGNDDGFGAISQNKFRVTSCFQINKNATAYAILSGRVLLQQQTIDKNKVNLILKPNDLREIKLPIKYIIYRGLNLLDFLEKTDVLDETNKVKTSGSELLVAMNTIQQQRASGTEIPVKALLGSSLSPAGTQKLAELFVSNSANSQLFDISGGIELGKFASGQIGIEIVLESPEYFPTVAMAKEAFYEIDVSKVSDPIQKKWTKEVIRHFVDPAAFYGLHHDVLGGIGYRDNTDSKETKNIAEVYSIVQSVFANKNKVYLDIRNENGYSYNYYDNYLGTGTEADQEFKVGQTLASLTAEEYYTDGWPTHVLTLAADTTAVENEFYLQLRINDNTSPLLVGRNVVLSPNTVIEPPLGTTSTQRTYFVDETHLLASTPTEFTEPINIKVPNIPGTIGTQIATLVRLDYIRQALPVAIGHQFPRSSFTDYLFGPVAINNPWNSIDQIQWFSSNHTTYVDALSGGYVLGQYKTTILAIDNASNEIEIFDEVPVELSEKVVIENSNGNADNEGTYTPNKVTLLNSKTRIKVKEGIPAALQAGDKLTLTTRLEGKMDYTNNQFVVIGKEYTSLEVLQTGNRLNFYSHFSFSNSYEIGSVAYDATLQNTKITFASARPKRGFAGFVETGYIIDSDATTVDNDRVIFYAAPKDYFINNGLNKLTSFNIKGGILNFGTILNLIPNVTIDQVNLKINATTNILTLSYSSGNNNSPALFLLGLTKTEHESAENTSASILSSNHIKTFKLLSSGTSKQDANGVVYYEYELKVAGLDNASAYQEVDTGIQVYTVDHLIFSSKDFGEKYKADTTRAQKALDNFLDYTLELNNKRGGSDFRGLHNYSQEESSNLSRKVKNYWNKYGRRSNQALFKLDPSMKDKVIEFRDKLNVVGETQQEIERLLKDTGADLIAHAKQQIKIAGKPWTNKDGTLYITRLIMLVLLKNHPKVLSSFPSKIEAFAKLFEKHSRGLLGSEKPGFSSHLTHKKVLIAGFDPFSGNFDGDGYYSNSSGNLVLALDGEMLNNDQVVIKSAIFPVRFNAFNDHWVEDFFKPYIELPNGDSQKPDMIITFSFFAKRRDFQFDRFAANFRNNLKDNEGFTPAQERLEINDSLFNATDTFIKNTLPYEKLAVANRLIIPNAGVPTPSLGVNHRAFWAIKAKNKQTSNIEYVTKHHKNKDLGSYSSQSSVNPPFDNFIVKITKIDPSNQHQVSNETKYFTPGNTHYIPMPSWSEYPDITTVLPGKQNPWANEYSEFEVESRKGSGANFLSNELHYRVAYLREKHGQGLPTGHIHLNFMGKNKIKDRNVMIESAKEIIKKLIG